MGLKLQNPKFNILCKIAFIFFIWNTNSFKFRGQWDHSGTSKSDRIGLWLYASIF